MIIDLVKSVVKFEAKVQIGIGLNTTLIAQLFLRFYSGWALPLGKWTKNVTLFRLTTQCCPSNAISTWPKAHAHWGSNKLTNRAFLLGPTRYSYTISFRG